MHIYVYMHILQMCLYMLVFNIRIKTQNLFLWLFQPAPFQLVCETRGVKENKKLLQRTLSALCTACEIHLLGGLQWEIAKRDAHRAERKSECCMVCEAERLTLDKFYCFSFFFIVFPLLLFDNTAV